MKRRNFILTGSAALIATAAGTYFLVNSYKESKWKKHPLIYPYILSGFCDEETLRKIGVSYRAVYTEENSSGKLMTLLSNGILNKESASQDSTAVVRQLEMKVEQDFKENKLIRINGWVLSKTEARQCALLSLS